MSAPREPPTVLGNHFFHRRKPLIEKYKTGTPITQLTKKSSVNRILVFMLFEIEKSKVKFVIEKDFSDGSATFPIRHNNTRLNSKTPNNTATTRFKILVVANLCNDI